MAAAVCVFVMCCERVSRRRWAEAEGEVFVVVVLGSAEAWSDDLVGKSISLEGERVKVGPVKSRTRPLVDGQGRQAGVWRGLSRCFCLAARSVSNWSTGLLQLACRSVSRGSSSW